MPELEATAERPVSAEPAQVTASSAVDSETFPGSDPHDSRFLARAALEADGPERTQLAMRVVWTLVGEGQMALAHEIAACLEHCEPVDEPAPWSALIRALILSAHIRSSYDTVAEHYREALREVVPPADDDNSSTAVRLLCAAMAMRPALLDASSGARPFLQGLRLESSALLELRAAIANYLKLNLELSPPIPRGVREQASWKAQVEAIQQGSRPTLTAQGTSTTATTPPPMCCTTLSRSAPYCAKCSILFSKAAWANGRRCFRSPPSIRKRRRS
ncbi:MAG: hypothetical protein ACOX6T_03590 [Myxococcales bacterium]|jgi:hypothetical protein